MNKSKTSIIVKDEGMLADAQEVFRGTGVNFTVRGKRHLGACIGSKEFKDEYCNGKVHGWCQQF